MGVSRELIKRSFMNALRAQSLTDNGVVHQLAEDG